ncbi:hypothetical protein JCM10450v2_003874 [Rhodotorula kratochvilovae]
MQYSHMYASYGSPYDDQHQHQQQQPPPPPPQPPPSSAYESSSHYPGSPSLHSPSSAFYSAGASANDPMLSQVYSSSAALDPIDGAYGPQAQALSTASPPAYAGTEHSMLDGEADMLQQSGLNAFDDVAAAARAFAAHPPAAQPVPRSYSYPTPAHAHAHAGAPLPSGSGAGFAPPAARASSPAVGGPSASSSNPFDAYARLRTGGSMSITPGAGGSSGSGSGGPSAMQQAMKARLAGPVRTASSPAVATYRVQYNAQQPQPTPTRRAEAYPGYSAQNAVYDLYGSSSGAGAETGYPSPQQHGEAAQSAFSQNPTAPSDPYDPKALGLPLPPPRVNTHDGRSATSNSYQNIYSTSGFDLVGVLARVVNRKNPTIEIGAVDMSCSFVVVDARKFDQPIVYASETFSRLTGYANEEIVGRNCRFLQAPGDQTVVQGEKRRYTDGNAAHHLRKHIVEGQETQVSLINYHKGGKPFINLVTCVPITWGDSNEVAFFVGFQVDLVDQPAAILDKMQNGSYIVNYSVVHATIARNPSVISFDVASAIEHLEDSAQHAAQQAHSHAAAHAVVKAGAPGAQAPSTLKHARDQIRADDPAELLDAVAGGGTGALANEGMRRQFMRLLVDECDDFIHVLSLKGALLYVSGASRRLLEYEPGELLGKTLSSFCHPSDIVSVQRELKDAGVAAHPTVSLVYRIRRKNSGYVWFEAQGRLHLEPGKGRKCVILSGRPREVYKMSWRDLELAGGVGASKHEFWAKVCVDGIFLTATQSAEKVLGVDNVTEHVVGKSIGDLTRRVTDDAQRFMAALADASRGNPSQVQHFMAPSPGAPLVEVVTRFYPARSTTDAAQSQPPPTEHFQPVAGKQVAIIAQISLAAHEHDRAAASVVAAGSAAGSGSGSSSTRATAPSSVSGASSSVALSSSSLAGRTTSTDAAVTAATTASASSAGVPSQAPVLAAAVPGTGPPGLTSFSAVPSTFKALAAPSSVSDNVFDELNVTRGTSWQFELHQMRLVNKKLREEREALEALKRKKALLAKAPVAQKTGPAQRACANCGRTQSAEWRSGPTGPKSLCNACGLRWSKAKSQAAAAAKQRKDDDNKVKVETASQAMGPSPSASRSNSRGSSGSGSGGSGSTNPTTVVPSPSPMGSYHLSSSGLSPSAPAMAHVHSAAGFAGFPANCGASHPGSAAASPLAMYAPMSLAPSPSADAMPMSGLLAHQPSALQHLYAPHPHAAHPMPSPYSGAEGPGPPPHGPV